MYCSKSYLQGFKFFDSNDTLIFEVGKYSGTMTSVLIGADEQIIGIKAKLLTFAGKHYQDAYTDFQLMLC